MLVDTPEKLKKIDNDRGYKHLTVFFSDGEVSSTKSMFSIGLDGKTINLKRKLHMFKPEGSMSFKEDTIFPLRINGFDCFVVDSESDEETDRAIKHLLQE